MNTLVKTLDVQIHSSHTGLSRTTLEFHWYVPAKDEVLDPYYSYFTIRNIGSDSLILRIRRDKYSRERDFQVTYIENKHKLGKANVAFFLKGYYYTDKHEFKNIRTGKEFNEAITSKNYFSITPSFILDFVRQMIPSI